MLLGHGSEHKTLTQERASYIQPSTCTFRKESPDARPWMIDLGHVPEESPYTARDAFRDVPTARVPGCFPLSHLESGMELSPALGSMFALSATLSTLEMLRCRHGRMAEQRNGPWKRQRDVHML